MEKAYKYRMYPNAKQLEELFGVLNFSRFLYNSALQERKAFYRKYEYGLSYVDQCASLKEIKQIFPDETSVIHSQVLQQVLKQLDKAFNAFFKGIKSGRKIGFPRFKSRNRFNSVCFPQVADNLSGIGGIKLLDAKHIKVFGITGNIKIKMHRPFQGRCCQVRIVKEGTDFYLAISCDNVPKNPLPKTNKIVAIDLGINDFAVFSDQSPSLQHPRSFKTSKETLAFRQRKLANKKKGSKNYRKQQKIIRKTHEHIANVRHDWQHKAANHVIKNYDKIIVEDLNVQSMLETKTYAVNNVNIADAAWGSFIEKLTYKAESADKLVVKVNPANTSKRCSKCGVINKDLTLEDRVFHCQSCGLTMGRDFNASKNILALGTSDAISGN